MSSAVQHSADTQAAIQAWNLMGGGIDWAALPIVAEMLGVHDVELLIHLLVKIRNR